MSEADAWTVWIVLLPLTGALFTFAIGGRAGRPIAILTGSGIAVSLVGLIREVSLNGPIHHPVGGWGAPLGIELYADGLSVIMLAMAAIVGFGVLLYSLGHFSHQGLDGSNKERSDLAHASKSFWPLWLFAWGALNALFLTGDIFNLYVTLELLTLTAVAMIGLARRKESSVAAFRYLLASLAGSLFYLLGVTLIYGEYSTLDWRLLADILEPAATTQWAIALMTLGLVMKTALFPLHFWLPPAHGNAPAPVSALLSALVVKASFYFVMRLWFSVFWSVTTVPAGMLLAGLGAAAVLYGSWQALRQRRLKMLVAYSTVAQVGYLFLAFALTSDPKLASAAGSGAVYYALSHASAKAAMFLAAGAIVRGHGHDEIQALNGIGQHLPMSVFAFALAGVSLMGLPPSGGFVGKWILLEAAIQSGHWWMVAVLLGGGLLAAIYVFAVVGRAFSSSRSSFEARPVPFVMESTALALALFAIALGLIATEPLELLQIGTPFGPAAVAAAS